MALFGRKKRPSETLQPPDALAQRAAHAYGTPGSSPHRFAAAASLYAQAIGKLHTMYIMGNATYRRPSAEDQAILDGFVSAVGAAAATDELHAARDEAVGAVHYLEDIAQFAQRLNGDGHRYLDAAERAGRELR